MSTRPQRCNGVACASFRDRLVRRDAGSKRTSFRAPLLLCAKLRLFDFAQRLILQGLRIEGEDLPPNQDAVGKSDCIVGASICPPDILPTTREPGEDICIPSSFSVNELMAT